ncbi:MAG: GTP 3',8-cyclase MoaA [Flavitalea sp.]
MSGIIDTYGRSFKVLRVSLLNRCNLGCVYCTENADDLRHANAIAGKEYLENSALLNIISGLHTILDLQTIRLTGGEPLLYPKLHEIVKGIYDLGIEDIKLTTNGMLLDRQAAQLKEAGLGSINVSLDAVNEDSFFRINRRDGLKKVLSGIDAALDAGIDVKLNAVILKGINDEQVLPLLEYAASKNIVIRFLEVMAMGHLHKDPYKYFFGQEEILNVVRTKFEVNRMDRTSSATANYWKTDAGFKFGIIANESAPFCHDCNRLRLDSEGKIFGCLSSNDGIDIRNLSGDQLVYALKTALKQKQTLKFVGSELSMLHIGG